MGNSRLGVLLVFGSFMAFGIARGEESYIPNLKQMHLFRERGDCSIYASIRGKTMKRYRELLVAQAKIKQIAKQRREALVLCGAPSEGSRRALQDQELASRCPIDFQKWVRTGESYFINQAELSESYRNLQSLAGLISYQCGQVPEVPESLPPEPEEVPSSDAAVPAENPS